MSVWLLSFIFLRELARPLILHRGALYLDAQTLKRAPPSLLLLRWSPLSSHLRLLVPYNDCPICIFHSTRLWHIYNRVFYPLCFSEYSIAWILKTIVSRHCHNFRDSLLGSFFLMSEIPSFGDQITRGARHQRSHHRSRSLTYKSSYRTMGEDILNRGFVRYPGVTPPIATAESNEREKEVTITLMEELSRQNTSESEEEARRK
ncbi:hypothetical protein K438DRAFT_999593 [Mycena galopus ATCC 62051]|nr:hypothetical protein K438DRAFT_999593 [Mycena galopus ATCC 62051]